MTRSEIDAQLVLDAGDRAQLIFADGNRGEVSFTSSTIMLTSTSKRDESPSE